jgi:hypothetical protein
MEVLLFPVEGASSLNSACIFFALTIDVPIYMLSPCQLWVVCYR